MITKANKVRGYKVQLAIFASLAEITTALPEKRLIGVVNAQLVAHQWNSQFEAALVKKATDGGLKMLTEKSEKGNDVVVESNAQFLKRTGFKVTDEEAQAIADGIAYPPVASERALGTSAYEKVATTKIDKSLASGKTLEDISAKLAAKGHETAEFTNADEQRVAVIAAMVEYLQSDED